MKRTAWAMLMMVISFLLGTIIAVGSLTSMGGRLDMARLTATPLSVSTVLVSCLDPPAILLEIAAIILLLTDSRQVGRAHHRLVWIATIFFVVWALANLVVFLPLAFLGMQRGSVSMVKAAQMVKAGAAVLQYSIPFLLAFSLTRRAPRVLLWLALALTVVGNLAVVTLPIAGIQLRAVQLSGQILYVPQFDVDYTAGPYPILLASGYMGGALYMLAYALVAWQTWKEVSIRAKQATQSVCTADAISAALRGRG